MANRNKRKSAYVGINPAYMYKSLIMKYNPVLHAQIMCVLVYEY